MSRFAPIALLVAGATLFLGAGPEARQWALIIGIDDYRHFEDEEGGDLRGAEADALRVRHAVQTVLGIESDNVLTLLGEDASGAAIRSAFTEWLPERVGRADRVFIYYSGHGSQMFDEDGDEPDGLDETICPVDVLPSSTVNDIADDEIRGWLEALPARRIVVVLDSCHSGTATRLGVGYSRARRLARPTSFVSGPVPEVGGLDVEDDPRIIEMAASAPGQPAVETEVPAGGTVQTAYGGAFTTRLVRKITSLPPGASLEDLFWATFHSVKAEGFDQDPQISGPADLFRLGGASSDREARLSAEYRVRKGAMDGSLRVYGDPPLESGMALRATSGHLLLVRASFHGGAVVEVMQSPDAPNGVGANVRGSARVEGVVLQRPSLLIEVTWDEATRPFRDALLGVADVRLVEGDGSADLALRTSARGDSVHLVTRDGSIRHSSRTQADRGELDRFRALVLRERNTRALALLDNPVGPFGLSVMALSHQATFQVGDPVEVVVTSEREGFVTLVDHSTDGTMTVLYPNLHSGPLQIGAGDEVRLPTPGSGLEIKAFHPAGRGALLALVTKDVLQPRRFEADGFARLDGPGDLFDLLAESAPWDRAIAAEAASRQRPPPMATDVASLDRAGDPFPSGTPAELAVLGASKWSAALTTYRVDLPADEAPQSDPAYPPRDHPKSR